MKLVSLIIPTYNRPELVHRAINSAVDQTYTNKQIIVVDDGSDSDYVVKLPSWYYKPWDVNKGGSAARNYGIEQAKGEYIVFIDDDNILHPQFLEKTLPHLESSTVDAVTTGRRIVYDDFEIDAIPTQNQFPNLDWGWLIKKEVFDKIKYDECIWGDEDADLGIQFTQKGFSYDVIPEILQTAYSLKEQDATANTYPTERRLRGLENFLSKNLNVYKDNNERRYILRLAGRNYLRAGHYLKSINYFYKSLMAKKNLKTFYHLLFAVLGWSAYDWYMSKEETK